MKKYAASFALALVLIILAASPVLAAPDFDVPAGPPTTSGYDFAQHVVQHAQDGVLGKDHNPGHHPGLANFEHHPCPDCP